VSISTRGASTSHQSRLNMVRDSRSCLAMRPRATCPSREVLVERTARATNRPHRFGRPSPQRPQPVPRPKGVTFSARRNCENPLGAATPPERLKGITEVIEPLESLPSLGSVRMN